MIFSKNKPYTPSKEELDIIRKVIDDILNADVEELLEKYGVITRLAYLIGHNLAKKLGIGIAYGRKEIVKDIINLSKTQPKTDYCKKLKSLLLTLYVASLCNKPTTKEMKMKCKEADNISKTIIINQYQKELLKELLGIDIDKLHSVRDVLKMAKYLNPKTLGRHIAESIATQIKKPEEDYYGSCSE